MDLASALEILGGINPSFASRLSLCGIMVYSIQNSVSIGTPKTDVKVKFFFLISEHADF